MEDLYMIVLIMILPITEYNERKGSIYPKSVFGSWASVLPPFQKIKKIKILNFKKL
jgi:hypothetical protein